MTPPPPADPIRPVGPLDGSVYVDRTHRSDRITRRRRRDEEDAEGDAGSRHGRDEHEDPARRRPPTPMTDTRAYDDHARHPVDERPPGRPHIDATA